MVVVLDGGWLVVVTSFCVVVAVGVGVGGVREDPEAPETSSSF